MSRDYWGQTFAWGGHSCANYPFIHSLPSRARCLVSFPPLPSRMVLSVGSRWQLRGQGRRKGLFPPDARGLFLAPSAGSSWWGARQAGGLSVQQVSMCPCWRFPASGTSISTGSLWASLTDALAVSSQLAIWIPWHLSKLVRVPGLQPDSLHRGQSLSLGGDGAFFRSVPSLCVLPQLSGSGCSLSL